MSSALKCLNSSYEDCKRMDGFPKEKIMELENNQKSVHELLQNYCRLVDSSNNTPDDSSNNAPDVGKTFF